MREQPSSFYEQQIRNLTIAQKKLSNLQTLFGWLRFLSLTASIILLWKLWPSGAITALAAFVFFLGLFLILLIMDLKNKEAIEINYLLIVINKQELKILDHQLAGLPDGQSFLPETHEYANDLDIFGKASLYQYINRTTSEQGGQRLADWLLQPSLPPIIMQRQEAIKELAQSITWGQQLRAYGISSPITQAAQTKINEWLKNPNKFVNSAFWKMARFIYPLGALASLLLYIFGIIPSSLFTPLTILLFIIAFTITRIIRPQYLYLNKILPQLESLQNSLRWMETATFRSPLLINLQKELVHDTGASASIRQLKRNLERFDYRFNPLVHLPLNTYLLWDLQQVMALEQWKSRNTLNIAAWFNALAEMEALVTLGTLSFNHPAWPFPALSTGDRVFEAKDLGHPLIPVEKRVSNSFYTRGKKHLSLVTGSNMAGKSTFLRSIGVNLVLAMMGSPCCCSRLEVSHMKVMSTMRINDNLEENTSTFYAELKKLKEIIQAVEQGEDVFLLLDEILRGTNSADRHTGSMALIRQLLHHNASGVIATHDLELTKLSAEFPDHLRNYHFDAEVNNEELYFDYRLKEGICQSMNASLLMKKIGIDL